MLARNLSTYHDSANESLTRMSHTAFQYRLYPTPAQEAALVNQLETLRHVYNTSLAWWRDAYAYEKAGRGPIIPRRAKVGGGERKMGLQETMYPIISGLRNLQSEAEKSGESGPHWLTQVSAVSVRDTIARVQKAFENFYRRCKQGATKKGYPRFKPFGRLRSIPFNNYGAGCTLRDHTGRKVVGESGERLNGFRLELFGVGRVKVKVHRPLVGKIKTVSVMRDVDDKWYATFVCEQPEQEVAQKEGPAVGLDVGLEHFLTTSDGEHVACPKFLKTSLPKLRRLQRAASRKAEVAKKSKRKFRECRNLQKSFRRVARLHVKVRNQRKEFHRKEVNRLVERYATVCVESLNVRGMMGNGKLSRAIGDAGWSGFVTTLKLKAAKAGVRVVEVDPRGTSQTCPECGAVVKKVLAERTHDCDCGYTAHRDHAAARVILARGTNGGGQSPVRHNVGPLPPEKSSGKVKRAGRTISLHSPVLPPAASGGGKTARKRASKPPPLANSDSTDHTVTSCEISRDNTEL